MLENDYNRKEKIDKYLKRAEKYISKKTYLKLNSLYDVLCSKPKKMVLAHGDLIPTNIMLDKESVKFIDWEYISYMPEYYDLAYFLLFSKSSHSLAILDNLDIDNREVYIDALILCLKEIQNWAKLYGTIDNSIIDKNIKRWRKELNYIINKIE
jgi:thiamine kinase-like enzyme